VYREGPIEFGYTNHITNAPDNHTPIIIEASSRGEAVVSGSDVWSDWVYAPLIGAYAHDWPEPWAQTPNPWSADREVPEIVLRRELVFVNGASMTQVTDRDALQPGSFFVDEQVQRIFLKLPPGVTIEDSEVEVGLRPVLWDQNHEDHVTVRGLVFEHAPTPWQDALGAVRISASRDFLMEDCVLRWTNWEGLYVGESEDVTIARSTFNHHGGQGWGFFRVRNVVVTDSETSYNNWRGAQGGFVGWSVGNKMVAIHGLKILRHKAKGNRSRGLWLDFDVEDVVLDALDLEDNELSGVWLEAGQGPITIRNSRFVNNGVSGILSTYSEYVVLDSNHLSDNAEAQIRISGPGLRDVQNFETEETLFLAAQQWVITHNEVVGPTAIEVELEGEDWQRFVRHLVSDENTFRADDSGSIDFVVGSRRWSSTDWIRHTAQDQRSEFSLAPR
jgi:hypothetical protein